MLLRIPAICKGVYLGTSTGFGPKPSSEPVKAGIGGRDPVLMRKFRASWPPDTPGGLPSHVRPMPEPCRARAVLGVSETMLLRIPETFKIVYLETIRGSARNHHRSPSKLESVDGTQY